MVSVQSSSLRTAPMSSTSSTSSAPAGISTAARVMPARWSRHLALSTPPLAWAMFQPNARGSSELTSVRGFGDRQVLRGYSHYLAERMLIAVSTLEVAVVAIGGRGLHMRQAGRWQRDRVLAVQVPAVGPQRPDWPAFTLVDLDAVQSRWTLRAVRWDRASTETFRLLTTG